MSTMSYPAKLTVEELHQLKWLMGGLLTLLAFWSLGSLEFSGAFFLLLAQVLVFVVLVAPRLVEGIPAWLGKVAVPLMVVFIVTDFALNFSSFLSPLVRMVMALLVYRMLAVRRKREDLQLLLLCLFCLVLSGALTVSLLFAVQILMFTPMAMAFLFVVCLLDHGEGNDVEHVNWSGFKWRALLERVWRVVDLRVTLLGGVLFVFVVMVSTVIFMLMPRFNLEQAIPFLDVSARPQTGFSEQVSLGEVTEISQDNSEALRVDVPSLEAIEGNPYWRMLVLDQYENGGFRASRALNRAATRRFRDATELGGWGVHPDERGGEQWTFYLEGGVSRYLPIPGPFTKVEFQAPQAITYTRDRRLYALDSVKQSVFSYRLTDILWSNRLYVPESEIEMMAGMRLPDSADAGSLVYPESTLDLQMGAEDLEYLSAINRELVGVSGVVEDVSEYSRLLTDYLRGRYGYSLRPSVVASAGDPIVGWLREATRGHCEYFAGSFVLLARQAGIPTRMVVGFSGGSWNAVEGYYVVRNRNAHAWVEIYDALDGSWLRVDPTPGTGSSDPEVQVRADTVFERGWDARLDSLRILWYRRVVDFDQDDQMALLETMEALWKDVSFDLKQWWERTWSGLKSWLRSPFEGAGGLRIVLVVCLVLCGLGLWLVRFQLYELWYRVWGGAQKMEPTRREAGRLLVRVERLAQRREDAAFLDELDVYRSQLQQLRFGPSVRYPEVKSLLAEVRRFIRKA